MGGHRADEPVGVAGGVVAGRVCVTGRGRSASLGRPWPDGRADTARTGRTGCLRDGTVPVGVPGQVVAGRMGGHRADGPVGVAGGSRPGGSV
ncbi:hypothetical protein GCM10018777_40610 [Streptomyces albogriseolus]|nr:hypothetical protein GCM10018777_40610 [Streptomyces viridodiastaticus]